MDRIGVGKRDAGKVQMGRMDLGKMLPGRCGWLEVFGDGTYDRQNVFGIGNPRS